MDAVMPLACLPVQIAGRNRLWRDLVMDAIRSDPQWQQGEYHSEPAAALRAAAGMLLIAGGAPIQMQIALPTRDAADEFLQKYMERELPDLDANDLLYQINASRDYDPSANLEKITAPMLWINSADDFINPPELGIAEREIKRVKNGRFVLLPASNQTHGHGTHSWAAVWQQYLGELLAARSGLWTTEDFRDSIALLAATLDHRSGRNWRTLADTAVAAQLLYDARPDWENWRRETDFYDEGLLIWMEADTVIRHASHGRRTLDDFCRQFHGGTSGPPEVKTYSLEDVLAALNAVAPYDWRGFFNERVYAIAPHAPLGGLTAAGWRLVYTDETPAMLRAQEDAERITNLSYSIGIRVKAGDDPSGTIVDVNPTLAAGRAGIAPGMKLIAVNGRRWSPEILREALQAAKNNSAPIELLIENADYFKTYSLDYHEGEKYPHLEPIPNQPDVLSEILKPLTAGR